MKRLTLIAWLVGVALAGGLRAEAQPVTTIYSFGKGPANPRAGLTLGPSGNFYGTTEFGGQANEGVVFKVSTNGFQTTLVSFGSSNGAWPAANLTLGPEGNFYGTTIGGGTNTSGTNSAGTVFKITATGTVTVLASFNGSNGGGPQAGLVLGPDGNFYGTTEFGGLSGDGTVFKMTTNGMLTTLVNFNGTNGANPLAGLVVGAGGNLYGTTRNGGTNGNFGTVFNLTTNGDFNSLLQFNGTNGAWPYGGVTVGPDGNLYGTTGFGGNLNGDFSGGSIFELTTNGLLTTLIRLADFGGANGVNPYAGLTLGPDGNFYGTTYGGGANGNGTVFQVTTNGILAMLTRAGIPYQTIFTPQGYEYYSTNGFLTDAEVFNGTLTTLYSFSAQTNGINPDGAQPQASLTLGPDGNFYGTAYGGGASGYGTAFKVTTNGTFTPLASFSGNTGLSPQGSLAPGPDGTLYGTANSGGTSGYGTLFKLTTGGALTTLVNFDRANDGANPQAGLVPGPGGNFYGTAVGGGSNLLQTGPSSYEAVSDGTVFALTASGSFTPLAYFNGTNGANPYGGLAVGLDGNLYGTTTYGGISNNGVVFRLMTNGTLTTLTNFTGANGANPFAGLALGSDGNFYGTSEAGGTNNDGTVFQVTTNGALTTLVYFDGANGANPNASLLLGPDGNFYGTAYFGGAHNNGTVFKVTTGGTLTTLVTFAQTNGAFPVGALALGPDGNFYGTTILGGTGLFGNDGTVFKMTTNGTLTTLYTFAYGDPNGNSPFAGLALATNGNFIHFYGATYQGGSGGGGTAFQLNLTTVTAMAENSTNTFYPLTNEVAWTTGGTLSLMSATATNGTVQITGAGIVFTPAANFTGTTTINYAVTNSAGGTNLSLISVLVTNIPPVANPDVYAVGENSATNLLSPLVNDVTGTSGGVLSLVSVSPTNGTALISGTNVLFTPQANFFGIAMVGYTITDNVGGTNSSLITIQVTNVPPVANSQSVTNQENVAQVITLTGFDPNRLPLTFSIIAGPVNGTLSSLTTNPVAVTYTPATNFVGADSFTFLVNNGQTNSAPATVNITVTATIVSNTPPVANPDFYTAAENSTNTFSPTANDVLRTSGGVLSLVSVSPTNGTALISGTNVIFVPAVNFLGAATIGYTIADGLGGTGTSLITVTVTNVPPVANLDTFAIKANSTNTFSPLANDVLGTPGGTLSLVSVSPTNGTAAISGTNVVFTPALNFLGMATIGYTITDNVGGTNFSVINVAVTNSIALAITAPSAGQVASNAAFTVTGTVTASVPPAVTNVFVQLNGGGWTNATTVNGWSNWTVNVTLAPGSNTLSAYAGDAYGNSSPSISVTFDFVTNAAALLAGPPGTPVSSFNNLGSSQVVIPIGGGVGVQPITNSAFQFSAGATALAGDIVFLSNTNNGTNPTNWAAVLRFVNPADPTGTNGLAATEYETYFQTNAGPNYFAGFSLLTNVDYLPIAATNADGSITAEAVVFGPVGAILAGQEAIMAYTASIQPGAGADLRLTASAAPAPVGVGSNLVYSLTVSNAGPATATGVVISNQLPASVIFVSATGGATPANGVLLLNLGSLTVGTNASVQIVVQPTAAGGVTNTFQVFADQADPVATNNFATVTVAATNVVETLFSMSTLTLTNRLTTSASQSATNYSTQLLAVMPGGAVVYKQTFSAPFANPTLQAAVTQAATALTNAGASSYLGPVNTSSLQSFQNESLVEVTNVIGTNITVVQTQYLGPTNIFVGPNQSQPLALLNGQIDDDTLTTFDVSNLVSTTITSNYLYSTVYVLTGVVSQVDVALILTAAPDPVSVGDPLTYSLTVTNNSSTMATGVVVSNTLPANVTVFSLLPGQGSATNQGNEVVYSVGSLPNGDGATLAIVVLPEVAGLLTNIAAVSSAQTDSNPANNVATNVTTAVNTPITNLVLTLLSSIALNPQTGLFEQSIRVANGGPATPSSVLVTVAGLPANAQVYNATGVTNGLYYVQSSSPLGVGSNLVFLLEYYVPTRVAPTNLTYTVQAGPVVIPPIVSGTVLNISGMVKLANGSVLVEFSAVPGQVYAIQYSSDMVSWQTALPVVTAPANQVQWIDSGPPKTISSPAQAGTRYYRVLLLTAH